MKIVSVINYKGGVGKTSITANLGVKLANDGLNVLLIDLDPQSSLTFSFFQPEEWQEKLEESSTIKTWFDSLSSQNPTQLSNLITKPGRVQGALQGQGSLDLIPSHLGLINVDLELATELGGASLQQAKRNYLKVHRRLADGLGSLSHTTYDLVLIDCPPNFNIVTKNAIVASDEILIPAKPDYLSTLGIDYLRRSLDSLVRDYNDYIEMDVTGERIAPGILGVVFTMTQLYRGDPIQAIRPYMKQVSRLGVPVFESCIRENKTLFSDAPQYGIPVVLQPVSAGTHQKVVDELSRLSREFITKLGI